MKTSLGRCSNHEFLIQKKFKTGIKEPIKQILQNTSLKWDYKLMLAQ